MTPRLDSYLARTNGNLTLKNDVALWFLNQLVDAPRNRQKTFSASSSGYCKRQQTLRFISFPEKRRSSSEQNAIFIHGHMTHLKWQSLLMNAGILTQVEVPCKDPELNLTGTVDGILDTGQGWELKSANSRSYAWVTREGPMKSHVLQIHCYMHMVKLDTWSLVYENKDTQEWKEFIVRWDDKIWNSLKNDLDEMNSAVVEKSLPAILPDCAIKVGTAFKQCPFADRCLNIDHWPLRGIEVPQ